MEMQNINKVILLVCLFSLSCKKGFYKVKELVWTDSNYTLAKPDSMINIIFEQQFNDTLYYTNGKIENRSFIKTQKSISRVEKTFALNHLINPSVITLSFKNVQLHKASIKLKKEFKYIYINREKEGKVLYLEYSNFIREYY
jgi:hypothetical protein